MNTNRVLRVVETKKPVKGGQLMVGPSPVGPDRCLHCRETITAWRAVAPIHLPE